MAFIHLSMLALRRFGERVSTIFQRLDSRLLAAAVLVEVLVALWFLGSRGEAHDVGFGFAPYVRSLIADRGYVAEVCEGTQLDFLSRMPFLPLFLASMGKLGMSLLAATFVKSVLLLGLLLMVLRRFCVTLSCDWRRSALVKMLLLLFLFTPLSAKHLSQLHYEESVSVLLLPLMMITAVAVAGGKAFQSTRRFWTFAFVGSLGMLYLLKSSYRPLFCVGALGLFYSEWRRPQRDVAVCILACAFPVGWGLFSFFTTGTFQFGSSWDGENLYRGLSEGGLKLYPWVSLDRLMDSGVVETPAGQVSIEQVAGRCAFQDELSWSAHFAKRARHFATTEKALAADFLLKKAHVVFLDVRPTPRTEEPGGIKELIVMGSMLISRAGLAAVAAWTAVRWRHLDLFSLIFVIALAAALTCPLLVGFAYDRHVFCLNMAVLWGLAAVLMTAREPFHKPSEKA